MREIVKVGDVVDGRYKILRPIAEGGMGTVFLAEHWLIKRKVALKFLHAELASDATAIRRFMNEALAAGTLGHPNIVESTDMGFTVDDVPYIVYEYVEGTLLVAEIMRLGRLPAARALAIAHQLAGALDAAHEAGIVHRDLKSDNVFITDLRGQRDHVKVLDFGISRFLAASDKTAAGTTLIGTPEFMAPEQILTPDSIDKRADVYALGVMLYEMLSGKVPFVLEKKPGHTRDIAPDLDAAHALLTRIIQEPPAPLVVEDAPAGLAAMICEKLLAKEPARRYQSMKEVQAALDAFAGVLPGGRPALAVSARRGDDEPSKPFPLQPISERTVSSVEVDAATLAREVKALGKRWSLRGGTLVLDLYSPQMTALARAVAGIAEIADEMSHHAQLHVEMPRLRMEIQGAKQVVDLVLAARVEQWLRTDGW